MDITNARIKIFIGSLLMIILQVFLAPVISINNVMPNFIVAFVVACIIARPDQQHLFFAFIMGIIYDLITIGPVGSMAFVLLIVTFFVSRILVRLESANSGILIVTLIASLLVIELIYGVFQVSLIMDSSFIDMIIYRALPCCVYDVIIGLICFPIMVRLLAPPLTHTTYVDDNNIKGW